MSKPRYRCWTKATNKEVGEPRFSHHWATSRRAWFKVFDDRVECGDWVLPVSSITQAVVFKSRYWFVPASVLRLRTSAATYQFGFNPWCRVGSYLPFEFTTEEIQPAYSVFSFVVRLAVVSYLIYWLWTKLA